MLFLYNHPQYHSLVYNYKMATSAQNNSTSAASSCLMQMPINSLPIDLLYFGKFTKLFLLFNFRTTILWIKRQWCSQKLQRGSVWQLSYKIVWWEWGGRGCQAYQHLFQICQSLLLKFPRTWYIAHRFSSVHSWPTVKNFLTTGISAFPSKIVIFTLPTFHSNCIPAYIFLKVTMVLAQGSFSSYNRLILRYR